MAKLQYILVLGLALLIISTLGAPENLVRKKRLTDCSQTTCVQPPNKPDDVTPPSKPKPEVQTTFESNPATMPP